MYKNNINEKARGTVANILNHYYSNGSEVPKEVLGNIDFKENIFKRVEVPEYKYANYLDIEESNIINCIKTLPFEAYSKYLTLDLALDKGKDDRGDKAISIALVESNFKLMEHIFSLVEKTVNNGDKAKDIGNRDLEEMFFSYALNLHNPLRTSSDRKESLATKVKKYDFFKKSVTLFNKYYNEKSKNWGGASNHNFENWHENYSRIGTILSRKNNESLLNNFLVSSKSSSFILEDIFKQYEGKHNVFINSDFVSIALKNSNFDFLDLLIKSKTEEDLFTSGLLKYFNLLSKELTNTYEKGTLKGLKNINVEKVYEYYTKNNLPFELNKDAIKVLLVKPEENGFDLLRKFVTKDTVVSNAVTLGQMSYMYDLCEILSKHGEDINLNVDLQYTTLSTYLNLKANRLLGNYEPTVEEKHKTIEHFTNNIEMYLPNVNRDSLPLEINSLLTKEILKEELNTHNEITQKKIKI